LQLVQFSKALLNLSSKYSCRRIEATYQLTGPDFSYPNGSLCAVKATEEKNQSQCELTRYNSKFLVSTSAVLHGVYLTSKYPRRKIEPGFQVTGYNFSPQTGSCVRSKRCKRAMNLAPRSLGTVASPSLQSIQFSIAFISPSSTHASVSRRHIR
jgi:hypothetical protein